MLIFPAVISQKCEQMGFIQSIKLGPFSAQKSPVAPSHSGQKPKPTSLQWSSRALMTWPLWHLLWGSKCWHLWDQPCVPSHSFWPSFAASLWLGSTFIQFAVGRFCFHLWFFLLLFALGSPLPGVKTQAASVPSSTMKGTWISAGICHGLNVSCMSLLFSLSVLETIGLIQIHPKDMTLYNITFSL